MLKKKIFVSLIAAMMLVSACSSSNTGTSSAGNDKLAKVKAAGKLVVGTSPDYPPAEFYIIDESGNKKIVGYEMSLAQAIADEIGVTLEIKATDFQGVQANIQSNQVDIGIAGFSRTEERAKVMDFSIGYNQESKHGWQGIMIRKEDAKKYATLDDFKNAKLTLGAQAGCIQYEMGQKLTDVSKIKQMGTLDALVMALNAKDIDAVIISTDNATSMLSTFPELMILPQEGFNLDPDSFYGVNVALLTKASGDENKAFLEVVNKVIEKANSDGSFEKWRAEAVEQAKQAVVE